MSEYRINEIKLDLDEALRVNQNLRTENDGKNIAVFCDEEVLKNKIIKKLKIKELKPTHISKVKILRRSIDARDSEVKYVYSLVCQIEGKSDVAYDSTAMGNKADAEILQRYEKSLNEETEKRDNEVKLSKRPVVIGFGPCGMFCALLMARAGLKPIVIERGSSVDERTLKVEKFWREGVLDTECNVQFGEGGAGTFSDGKLNTGIKDKRIKFVLETMVNAGADSDILIDARPHVGTDLLKTVVRNIREEILSLGGEVRFDTRMEELVLSEDWSKINIEKTGDKEISKLAVKGIIVSRQGNTPSKDRETEFIESNHVVLAIGHSARDTFRGLYDQGIYMEPKQFSMGVRVEHLQKVIDEASYGASAGHPALPPAYYKLSYRAEDGRGVYSFCMCPGGEIVNAASQTGGVVTNGMSLRARNSGSANSGILVDVRPIDFGEPDNPMSGISFQEKYEHLAFVNGGENYRLPETSLGDFMKAALLRRKENSIEEEFNSVADSLPDFVAWDISEAMPVFGKRIKGFDDWSVKIKGIETRSSSPVKIVRDRDSFFGRTKMGEHIKGFYPSGEGAGYAGGITSAACDGIKIAEAIINCYL